MLKVSKDVTKLNLITCVVQRGKAEKVWAAARAAGAGGATIHFSRGMGVRERMGLLGVAIAPEKEVIVIVAFPTQTERIFRAIVRAGQLDVPGQGIAYTQPIGHCAGIVLPSKGKPTTKKKSRNKRE